MGVTKGIDGLLSPRLGWKDPTGKEEPWAPWDDRSWGTTRALVEDLNRGIAAEANDAYRYLVLSKVASGVHSGVVAGFFARTAQDEFGCTDPERRRTRISVPTCRFGGSPFVLLRPIRE